MFNFPLKATFQFIFRLKTSKFSNVIYVVSRIEGKTEVYEFDVSLDINSDIFPVKIGEFYKIAIAAVSSHDNEALEYHSIAQNSLFDEYDYVMHGKVFRYEEYDDGTIAQYISFGGLILKLKGDSKSWSTIYGNCFKTFL